MTAIDDIRQARNTALAALKVAFDEVDKKIPTGRPGPDRNALIRRREHLQDERDAIRDAADEAILALPDVVAAAAELVTLSAKMKKTADDLPGATDALAKANAILSLGQQFTDLITGAAKPS